jgi:hypothetical protein
MIEWNKIDGENDSQFPRYYCLVAIDEYGTIQTHVAVYYRQYEEECRYDIDDEFYDYNEEEDQYYVKSGWYQETPDGGEYSSIFISNQVLAWAKLPKYEDLK